MAKLEILENVHPNTHRKRGPSFEETSRVPPLNLFYCSSQSYDGSMSANATQPRELVEAFLKHQCGAAMTNSSPQKQASDSTKITIAKALQDERPLAPDPSNGQIPSTYISSQSPQTGRIRINCV